MPLNGMSVEGIIVLSFLVSVIRVGRDWIERTPGGVFHGHTRHRGATVAPAQVFLCAAPDRVAFAGRRGC